MNRTKAGEWGGHCVGFGGQGCRIRDEYNFTVRQAKTLCCRIDGIRSDGNLSA